jgi:L,D-peptidoglycan transpeptidase YkuD (ErfK/YbiS/YcfS/YnhG family)
MGDIVRRKPNLAQKRRQRAQKCAIVRVFAKSDAAISGTLSCGNVQFPAALGKGGVRALKREGDGAAPMGIWPLAHAYYRPDRMKRPLTGVRIEPLRANFGWCDAPADRNYNRRVTLPYPSSTEHLWREDHLYDAIVVVCYNIAPRAAGRGSAIFLHAAHPSFTPTAGCVALKREHLLRLLTMLPRSAAIAMGKSLSGFSAAAVDLNKGRSPAFRARVSWRRWSPHG